MFSKKGCLPSIKSFHKEPNLLTKLSWRIKIQNASEISISFLLLIREHLNNQTALNWNHVHLLAPPTVSETVYLQSRQTPPAWVTTIFLNLEFPCLYFDNSGSKYTVSVKGEGNIVVIQKMTIKRQISEFTYYCYGKTILPNHWNYHRKKLQPHSNDAAPKMQWNWSARSFQVWPRVMFSTHLEVSEN